MSDDSGGVVQAPVREAGGDSSAGSSVGRYGFAQREHDTESGLVHMRARQYDPKIGRFTQTDPLRENRPRKHYRYAANNPTQLVDPYGMDDWARDPNFKDPYPKPTPAPMPEPAEGKFQTPPPTPEEVVDMVLAGLWGGYKGGWGATLVLSGPLGWAGIWWLDDSEVNVGAACGCVVLAEVAIVAAPEAIAVAGPVAGPVVKTLADKAKEIQAQIDKLKERLADINNTIAKVSPEVGKMLQTYRDTLRGELIQKEQELRELFK